MQSKDKVYGTVERPREIVTICDSDTAMAAALKMRTNKVGCLVVNDYRGKLVGIITEQDIVNRAVASCLDLERTTVAGIMTTQVVSCSSDTPLSKAREIMTEGRIRHLPVVKDGVVVEMLSTRDIMAQQLLEDRTAVEQVAMLSTCLKSIDLSEVINMVTSEVPKLFQAEKCVLCFYEDDSGRGFHFAKKAKWGQSRSPALISYNNCTCPENCLRRIGDINKSSEGNRFFYDSIPDVCENHGGRSPSVVIPLTISRLKEASSGKTKHLSGYLCMCSLPASAATNNKLISYKGNLSREILNSHLTNARQYQAVRTNSLTDALTELGSRRLLEDKLQAECARVRRYKHPLSVAIVDLDNFKTINDLLGHAAGDEALRKLATCMKEEKRGSDVLARYGGDEFVIIMPETRSKDALVLLQRIRVRVQGVLMPKDLSMTISCGVAEIGGQFAASANELIHRADLALYEAKNAGRNCIMTWDQTMSGLRQESGLEMERIRELQGRVAGLSAQSEEMFIQSIWGLVQALEAKDAYTKSHSENVMRYAVGIAETMKIDPQQVELIRRAAMIHDVGKIGIPDTILSKPARLTGEERRIVEQHPLIAVRILDKMRFLEREMIIVRYHHERWDGKGYPDGLAGKKIPLGARIMAVADAFDAITSNRPYHKGRSLDEAMTILVEESGSQFDPKAVGGMVSCVQEVREQLGKTTGLTVDDLLSSKNQIYVTA